MTLELNGRPVEVDIDMNRDGSRFIAAGYYVDNDIDLTSNELDQLQELYDDSEELNGWWRG